MARSVLADEVFVLDEAADQEHAVTSLEDRELVIQAAAGDALAFETIVHRHTDAVWRMARSLLYDDFAAQEAVQDTFLKAFRNLAGFRGESKVSTWLLTICHRTCIDRLRLRRADLVPLDQLGRQLGRQLTRETAHEERPDLRLALEDALAQLPAEEREAFVLVEVVGHSREDAAGIVGVPPSTMRSRVSRARDRLARALGEARAEAAGDGSGAG